ncbi:putative dual-specificity kinase TKL-Pl-2 family [Rosa chinensis]|uniref:Putative dual-specificity kinase TKL-Pl-2 family n=1 Tax=Rosa chinensis TaxID=74649 RepID=A0A2P6R2F4_ROSCH|nr:uncharacterized protein LOC112197583 [Rosa chinensis]PRQ40614.1 putative dual-specificity kinase TKL-Pl-2 family [Rosa chinensis]
MEAPISVENPKTSEDPETSDSTLQVVDDDDGTVAGAGAGADSILDVSGQSLDFPIGENSGDDVGDLYLYKNVYNLLPKSITGLKGLKTLKFFSNEINLFSSPEIGDMARLECMRISSPEFDGLPLHKFKALKELELSKVTSRCLAVPILSQIAGLKLLTKLSVCYFSITFLPPEICCLKSLEHLDLSFNKMKTLPGEIGNLNALVSLRVANNKLEELPEGLSRLARLENLDLSHNRLTSLGVVDFGLMLSLRNLNLKYNRLSSECVVPSWICCDLDGNGNDESGSSSVELDCSANVISVSSKSRSRFLASWRSDGRKCYFRWRAPGCVNKGRMPMPMRVKEDGESKTENVDVTDSAVDEDEDKDEGLVSQEAEICLFVNSTTVDEGDKKDCEVEVSSNSQEVAGEQDEALWSEMLKATSGSKRKEHVGDLKKPNCKNPKSGGISGVSSYDISLDQGDKNDYENEVSSASQEVVGEKDEEASCLEKSETTLGSKRKNSNGDEHVKQPDCENGDGNVKQPDCKNGNGDVKQPDCKNGVGDNKQHKRLRLDQVHSHDCSNLSQKFSDTSFCGIEDSLQDGFYDAGRDRPFMPLESYDENFPLDSREVIFLDSGKDDELDGIFQSARDVVRRLNELNDNRTDERQIAMFLALFVSDHFGGSDSVAGVERRRKGGPDANVRKPFVCTCSTRNGEPINLSTKPYLQTVEVNAFVDISEKSLRSIKARHKSILVPIGTVQYGVCRHRALLLKYLCDRMEPRVPCELVRGYLDFMPHAWNIIPVKRVDSTETRWIVDACRPNDMRKETDPEYYCRYIPMTRIKVPLSGSNFGCSLPHSLLSFDGTLNKSGSSLIQCKYGSVELAAKMRTLEVDGTSGDDVRKFEYNCLGEVRMLSALHHPCIVELYGHQISSKWAPSVNGTPGSRTLQSAIFMEYINGGSLKSYIEKLSKAGEKHVPVHLAVCIAKNVASALVELHSKNIIHRDIKSENILIDLNSKTADGTPVVKLCDFDRAVPLQSYLHSCLVAHVGIPPPNVCVGTPRWMAPEVLRTMHEQNIYGLEVDIWSFGCLLSELLTLQLPYSGVADLEIHDLIVTGQRPKLTDELEALLLYMDEPVARSAGELGGTEADLDTLTFLVDLFCKCTEENPQSRPTAENIYKLLLEHSMQLTNSS